MTYQALSDDLIRRWDPAAAPLERVEFEAGDLEVRQGEDGSEFVSGSFPYGETATVRDRGRVRKERFQSYAFAWQIQEFEKVQQELADAISRAQEEAIREVRLKLARRNVDLLSGHQYGQPIANLSNGTLLLTDGADALRFRAALPPPGRRPTWVEDTVRGIRTGLVRGVSPGFRVPPRSAVPDAITLFPERAGSSVYVRTIKSAVLYELSLVTRPAYAGSSVVVELVRAAAVKFAPDAARLVAREAGVRLAARIGGRTGAAVGAAVTNGIEAAARAALGQSSGKAVALAAGRAAGETATRAAIRAASSSAAERVAAALAGRRYAGAAAKATSQAVEAGIDALLAGVAAKVAARRAVAAAEEAIPPARRIERRAAVWV